MQTEPTDHRRSQRRASRPRTPASAEDASVALEHAAALEGVTVAGLDEVGRGAWAGPLTVGAVVLDLAAVPRGLRDSKRLAVPRREELAAEVRASAVVRLGEVEHDELDELGLAAALRVAARRAVAALPIEVDRVLIDGNVDLLAGTGWQAQTIVGGDDACASIAAASIVAKVHRDARMRAVDPRHPVYGFAAHKGYPSPAHRAALAAHGPCALHRRSWQPIQQLLGAPRLPLDRARSA